MIRLSALRRHIAHAFGWAAVDLRKDVGTGMFLPGHLRALFRKLEINCVVDVGANRGDYAAMLRGIGFEGLIISVEPLSEVCNELATRAAGDIRWRVLNFAAAAQRGEQELNVSAARDLSSLLRAADNAPEIVLNSQIIRREFVPLKRLDEVVPEIMAELQNPRVFLKLDTQGYDLQAMEGARGFLSSILGLQSELSVVPLYQGMPDYVQALGYYRDLGFRPTGFYSVVGHRRTRRVIEFDVVFTRD